MTRTDTFWQLVSDVCSLRVNVRMYPADPTPERARTILGLHRDVSAGRATIEEWEAEGGPFPVPLGAALGVSQETLAEADALGRDVLAEYLTTV